MHAQARKPETQILSRNCKYLEVSARYNEEGWGSQWRDRRGTSQRTLCLERSSGCNLKEEGILQVVWRLEAGRPDCLGGEVREDSTFGRKNGWKDAGM